MALRFVLRLFTLGIGTAIVSSSKFFESPKILIVFHFVSQKVGKP